MVKEIEWYTTEQAAQYLQITAEVVRQKARGGTFKFAKVGQEFRFSKASLDEWLEAGGDAGERERETQAKREAAAAALAEVREIADQAVSYLETVGTAGEQQIAEGLNLDGIGEKEVGHALCALTEDARLRGMEAPVHRSHLPAGTWLYGPEEKSELHKAGESLLRSSRKPKE